MLQGTPAGAVFEVSAIPGASAGGEGDMTGEVPVLWKGTLDSDRPRSHCHRSWSKTHGPPAPCALCGTRCPIPTPLPCPRGPGKLGQEFWAHSHRVTPAACGLCCSLATMPTWVLPRLLKPASWRDPTLGHSHCVAIGGSVSGERPEVGGGFNGRSLCAP